MITRQKEIALVRTIRMSLMIKLNDIKKRYQSTPVTRSAKKLAFLLDSERHFEIIGIKVKLIFGIKRYLQA